MERPCFYEPLLSPRFVCQGTSMLNLRHLIPKQLDETFSLDLSMMQGKYDLLGILIVSLL